MTRTKHPLVISKPFKLVTKLNADAETVVCMPPDSVVGRVAGPGTAAKHTKPAVEPMAVPPADLGPDASAKPFAGPAVDNRKADSRKARDRK